MNTRRIWIVAVGAALLVIAVNVFRSREQGSAGSDSASLPAAAVADPRPVESLAPDRPAAGVGAAPAAQQAADADAPGGADFRERPQPVPVLLPNQVPATPMSQALEELEIPPIPELLETEREFAAESVDPLWSTATEARILGKIAEVAGLELVSLNVECRTTLCRLQFVEPGTVAGRPGVTLPGPDRTASNRPSVTDLVRASGLKGRWVIAVRDRNGTPVSLSYLERGEAADTSGAPDAAVR